MNLFKHSTIKRALATVLILGMLITAGGLMVVTHILHQLPTIDAMYLNTYGTTEITDKEGNTLYVDTSHVTQSATLDELPDVYVKGLVAAEDDAFWSSRGYSLKGMLHALMLSRGGSTIEQQLIKNTYYNGGKGYHKVYRKIHELFLARQMDSNFDKKAILTFYVNKLELGEGATGIKSAMRVYFDKSPQDYHDRTPENISQLAYLAGLGQAPTTYDLYEGDAGLSRQATILSLWKDHQVITPEEYEDARQVDVKATLAPRYHYQKDQKQVNQRYKDYTEGVLQELQELGYDTKKATLKVKTFFDPEEQEKIRSTVLSNAYPDDKLEVGVAVMDKDGIVKGLIGGRTSSEWNHALQTQRSSGSSMKPFTAYGPLFQYFGNQYNTASRISSADYVYPGTNFVMHNYGGYHYGQVDLQKALRLSLNTPVARIADQVLGSQRMKQFLANVHLDVKESYSANDAIGLNISPLQAAAAYHAISHEGVYTAPRFVDQITFVDGTVRTIGPRQHQAMNASVAYVLTQMLRGVPKKGGTAEDAEISDFSGYAGKTGSVAFAPGVNNYAPYGAGGSDIWYDSFTHDGYTVAIWMGYDQPNTSPQVADSYHGHQVLGKHLQQMLNQGREVTNWKQPDQVKALGGQDLDAHYAVKDSQDVPSALGPTIEDVTLPDFKSLRPYHQGDEGWDKGLTDRDKANYHLYQQQPNLFRDPDVLSDKAYRVVTGRKGEDE